MKFYATEDIRGANITCTTNFYDAKRNFETDENAFQLVGYEIAVNSESICRILSGNPYASSVRIYRKRDA